MAWVVSFNSFKGGSGRSTTCINVASQLAADQKRVLVIDLDVDGPGLGTLLDISDEELNRRGAVSYLSSGRRENLRDHVVQVRSKGVSFDFMGAPLNIDESSDLPAAERLEEKIRSLREQAEQEYDFVIIDAASGFSNNAALAFSISDSVVLCFKWSLQHCKGMLLTAKVLCLMLESDGFTLKDFTLVANAVPKPVTREEKRKVDDVSATLLQIFKDRWESELTPAKLVIPEIQTVSELPSMKFFERITSSDEVEAEEYRRLADYLLKRSELALR
jgi:MinD-like ATPase involved in chromosome partitioning or flagellar assembly